MNRFQKVVIGLALANILLVLAFPPFMDVPIGATRFPVFDGFYPVFARLGHGAIHTDLLGLEIIFVAVNGLAAWLALEQRREGTEPPRLIGLGIALFTATNLFVLLAFPPYESYPGILRGEPSSFDGFYFVLGDRTGRPVFKPVLLISLILLASNALAAWLMLTIAGRRARTAQPEATAGSDRDNAALDDNPLLAATARDRRAHTEGFTGTERRANTDRRRTPRESAGL